MKKKPMPKKSKKAPKKNLSMMKALIVGDKKAY